VGGGAAPNRGRSRGGKRKNTQRERSIPARDRHHRLTALLPISAASHSAGIPTAEGEEILIHVPPWDHKDLERQHTTAKALKLTTKLKQTG